MNHEPARQQVERFVRRFESSYRQLACYAALPLVLTPELVNYLRNQFLRSNVPWVAEADLLLSDLCNPVGYEQYAIEPAVRAYLLSEMETKIGRIQMQAVAKLLLRYIQQLAQANPETLLEKELEVQQWAAMVYLDDQRQSVVQQLASRYEACAAVGKINADMARAVQSELDRLVRITQELSKQLGEYPGLVSYAELLGRLLYEPGIVTPAELKEQFIVGGKELTIPSVLLPEVIPEPTFNDLLQTFEFEIVTIEEVEARNLVPSFPPPLKTKQFTIATITIETNSLQPFDFTVATIQRSPKKPRRNKEQEWIIQRQQGRAYQFIEVLGENLGLEMVAIPGGSFLMGSPSDEPARLDTESPQHEVTVAPFFMGRYPITQAQWKAVAAMPQVERSLKEDPSRFKDSNRPVGSISWHDAVEFCIRLTQYTNRSYRLPSEAEWEYACRAGTTTPFHFGETIATELANYNGADKDNGSYNNGPKGIYRRETTPVDHFGLANALGLADMHGNVWEWCSDRWHDNYEDAPIDGSTWLSESNKMYILRGGSWLGAPLRCRSAARNRNAPDVDLNYLGFRVCCSSSMSS
jgi:formylglycine-generating enzyme required for sulfatase activity